VSEESNITLRLRAESDGVIVTLEGLRKAASEILDSFLGKPMSRPIKIQFKTDY